jgi:hypothetical protein
MIAESDVKSYRSSPSVLGAIQFYLNGYGNTEVGIRPFEATFGSVFGGTSIIPTTDLSSPVISPTLEQIHQNLLLIRQLSFKHQYLLVDKRKDLHTASKQTKFQPGDFVLLKLAKMSKEAQLVPTYQGPFEVINQFKNDVETKHPCLGYIKKFHYENLGLFPGTREDALRLSALDRDQHVIITIDSHRGNPLRRTSMEFGTLFADGDHRWLPWARDITDTTHFELYCRAHRDIFLLIFSREEAQRRIKVLNSAVLPVTPRTTFFLPLRYYG